MTASPATRVKGIDIDDEADRARQMLRHIIDPSEPAPVDAVPVREATGPRLADDTELAPDLAMDGKPVLREAANPDGQGRTVLFVDADGATTVLSRNAPEASAEALIFRAADGWSEAEARTHAARKALQEGPDVLEAARLMRENPDALDTSVSLASADMRQARSIARLGDSAFDDVASGRVPPELGALVADLVPDQARHAEILSTLHGASPENAAEARRMIGALMHRAELEPMRGGIDDVSGPAGQRQIEALERQLLEDDGSGQQRFVHTLLLIRRFAEKPQQLINFAHTYFYSGRKITGDIHALTAQLIIPFARDYKAYVVVQGRSQPKLSRLLSTKVFIVHGHDDGAREAVARYLATLGLEPIILHEQASRGMTIIEKVEANSDVGFAVVLLTPDDEGSTKGGKLEPRARQNVLLELGYFIGKLGRHRVCALKRGDLEIPSDFAGVVWEKMDASSGWKLLLGRELKAAGYSIDWNKVIS